MKAKVRVKCPWCMKMVLVHKGRLASHLQGNKVKCVGIGQPITLEIFKRDK